MQNVCLACCSSSKHPHDVLPCSLSRLPAVVTTPVCTSRCHTKHQFGRPCYLGHTLTAVDVQRLSPGPCSGQILDLKFTSGNACFIIDRDTGYTDSYFFFEGGGGLLRSSSRCQVAPFYVGNTNIRRCTAGQTYSVVKCIAQECHFTLQACNLRISNIYLFNIYAVRQDTQSVSMSELFSTYASSTCFGPHHIPNLRVQLVKDAPDDGPMRSETC